MNFATVVAVVALTAIVVSAITYLIRQKKSGVKCIGCPLASACQANTCECENPAIANGKSLPLIVR